MKQEDMPAIAGPQGRECHAPTCTRTGKWSVSLESISWTMYEPRRGSVTTRRDNLPKMKTLYIPSYLLACLPTYVYTSLQVQPLTSESSCTPLEGTSCLCMHACVLVYLCTCRCLCIVWVFVICVDTGCRHRHKRGAGGQWQWQWQWQTNA